MIGQKINVSPLKRQVFTALLAAIAVVIMQMLGFPLIAAARFLKYEPSGTVILLCGILMGPAAAAECAVVKCILYFLVHGGSPFGHISDLIAMLCMAVTASALMYRKPQHSLKNRIVACVVAGILTTVVMSLANYPILYLQYGTNAAGVTAMQVYLIPFNLLKTGLNSLLALFLYSPLYKGIIAIDKSGYTE